MSTNYERIYEVGLLDDLHNYFPALLYQQSNFRTVQDVLGYIRERTTHRFNLFDYGRRQYEATPRVNTTSQVDEVHLDFNTASILPFLQSLRQRDLYEDVIVHASQTIVNEASTEIVLEQDLEPICTICQDRMRQGEVARKLNVCQHTFHKSCIDIWLLTRSIHCPTCRHDIREPTLSHPSSHVRDSPRMMGLPAPAPVASLGLSLEPATSGTTGRTTSLRQRDNTTADIMSLLFALR